MENIRSIGVLTGGGDCPGLNAVIRAVVKTAAGQGIKVWGIKNGFFVSVIIQSPPYICNIF